MPGSSRPISPKYSRSTTKEQPIIAGVLDSQMGSQRQRQTETGRQTVSRGLYADIAGVEIKIKKTVMPRSNLKIIVWISKHSVHTLLISTGYPVKD